MLHILVDVEWGYYDEASFSGLQLLGRPQSAFNSGTARILQFSGRCVSTLARFKSQSPHSVTNQFTSCSCHIIQTTHILRYSYFKRSKVMSHNWPACKIPKMWPIECFNMNKHIHNLEKKSANKSCQENCSKLFIQVRAMIRGI